MLRTLQNSTKDIAMSTRFCSTSYQIIMDEALENDALRHLAMEMYLSCAEEPDTSDAMIRLARAYLSGKGGTPRQVSLALLLCEKCLYNTDATNGVLLLAKDLTLGENDIQKDVELGIQLFQLCVDMEDLPEAKFALAEVYILGGAHEEVLQQAMVLLERSLESGIPVYKARQLADVIANGTSAVQQNIPLAARIYGLCIDLYNDPESMGKMAEILVSDGTGVQKDVNRAVGLCKAQIDSKLSHNVLNLVEKLATGTTQIPRNVRLAVHLCGLCINIYNTRAMAILARILLSGTPRDQDIDRAIGLCYLICATQSKNDYCYRSVLRLAKDLASGTSEISRNLPLAIQLGEICVARNCDEYALTTFTKILLVGNPGPQATERVVNLFERAAKENKYCASMVQLAKEIWGGTPQFSRNVSLAIQLCEIYIKHDHVDTMLTLAEFLLTGPASVRDIRRGVQLCEEYLNRTGSVTYFKDVVGDIATKVAKGTCDAVANKALAEELHAMGIDKD